MSLARAPDSKRRLNAGLQAESNTVVVDTGGGKGRSSCRRFFCRAVLASERLRGLNRPFGLIPGTATALVAGSNRDKPLERNRTAIEAHWDSGWSVLGQRVNGTGTG